MAMSEQAKAARREYKRRWNRANKDKVRAAQERYWQRVYERQEATTEANTDEPQQQEE